MATKKDKKKSDGADLGFEAKLFLTADKLLPNNQGGSAGRLQLHKDFSK